MQLLQMPVTLRWGIVHYMWIYALWCLSSGLGDPGMTLDVKGQALDLAVIGNCRTAALVDTGGRIVWWCFPRFDSDPVFSRLLAGNEEKGFCDVALEGQTTTEAAYQRNTAIVETIIRDDAGNAVRITDFTPRFKRFERIFNPSAALSPDRADCRSAAHQDQGAPHLQLRPAVSPAARSAPTIFAIPAASRRCA